MYKWWHTEDGYICKENGTREEDKYSSLTEHLLSKAAMLITLGPLLVLETKKVVSHYLPSLIQI